MSYDSGTAVSVKNLSKAYKIFDTPAQRLCWHLLHVNRGTDFWALQDVSFDIKKGESFGIIGKNGSGKSTMLQILAGIIPATSGRAEVHGRVAALLELGSGFHPESTGLENIYMNAAVLGVPKETIDQKAEQIIAFADIGDFVSQPVKTYSSGMYVRLAFAVAIHVDADILLIDEALAVGDVFFRQKCYAKLNQLKEEGKTIILVSHGMNEVEQFCERALLLNHGRTAALGDSREVVKKYYILDVNEERTAEREHAEKKPAEKRRKKNESAPHGPDESSGYGDLGGWEIKDHIFYDLSKHAEVGSGKVHIAKIGVFDQEGYAKRVFSQGEWAYFFAELEVRQPIGVPLCGIVLYDHKNTIVHGKDFLQLNCGLPHAVSKDSRIYILQKMKMDLGIGDYTFDFGMASMDYADYEKRAYRTQEEVNAVMERLAVITRAGSFSVHTKPIGEPMQLMFHGCADLPGDARVMIRRQHNEG